MQDTRSSSNESYTSDTGDLNQQDLCGQADLAERLADHALFDLVPTLEKYGCCIDLDTVGGRAHNAALHSVLSAYSWLAVSGHTGRVVFPMAVGLGKTQSIASWCYAVHDMGLELSVLICQDRIESLVELQQDMRAKGIPAAKIGLLHYKRSEVVEPSINVENAPRYQFLLVSHSKVHSRSDFQYLSVWEGRFEGLLGRSLCIWDESLLRREGRALAAADLEKALAYLQAHAYGLFKREEIKGHERLRKLILFVGESLQLIKRVLDHRDASGEAAFRIPRFDAGQIELFQNALAEAVVGDARAKLMCRPISEFLEVCQERLRVVSLGQGNSGTGLITFLPLVPDELSRIVILDASHRIRELTLLDDSLMSVTGLSHAKDFSAVSVTQYVTHGGRYSMDKMRVNSRAVAKLVSLILALPPEEAVLIATYKPRKISSGVMHVLHKALKEAGIDLDAKVSIDGEFRRRINFINWGQEKSTSRYSYCKYMVAFGVLRQTHLRISSCVAAQSNDLMTSRAEDGQYLSHVIASEQFYCLHQLIGRGKARRIKNGLAEEAIVYVFDQTDFSPFVEEALPGCQWNTIKLPPAENTRPGTREAAAIQRIEDYLWCLQGDICNASDLRRDLELDGFLPSTITRARKTFLKTTDEWVAVGHQIVRSANVHDAQQQQR